VKSPLSCACTICPKYEGTYERLGPHLPSQLHNLTSKTIHSLSETHVEESPLLHVKLSRTHPSVWLPRTLVLGLAGVPALHVLYRFRAPTTGTRHSYTNNLPSRHGSIGGALANCDTLAAQVSTSRSARSCICLRPEGLLTRIIPPQPLRATLLLRFVYCPTWISGLYCFLCHGSKSRRLRRRGAQDIRFCGRI